MRLHLPLLMALLTIFCFFSYGQTITLKGRVMDDKNRPMAGVSVVVKGTRTGTATSEDGTFALNVSNTGKLTLIATSTGYKPKEIEVAPGATDIQVILATNASTLDDVVVVSALGLTRKAKSVTYSSQSVDPTALTEARDVNLTNALAGKVAGIQVTTTGQPGSSTRVILRGDNSLTGSNQPLWVVDGVPISNNSGESGNLDYGNGAQDLNPDDIESIEVLKGPNAAALYGSRAANGAILITTKKGKPGDKTLGIALNQNFMKYTVTEWPAYQNVYGEGGNGRLVTNNALIVPGTNAVNMGSNYQSWGMPMLGQPYNTYSGQPHGYYPQRNNMKDFYQSPYLSTTNFSVSKADALSAFRVSYTFTKGNDVVQNLNLKTKHNVTLTASRKLGSRITVDARVLYTNDDTKNRMTRNISPGNPLSLFIWEARSVDINTFLPYKDANGNSLQLASLVDAENPYWSIFANSNRDTRNRLIGGPGISVDIARGLKLRAQVSGDLNFGTNYVYQELGGKVAPKGFYSNNTSQEQNWLYEAQLIYNKQISSDFNINGVVGANVSTFDARSRGASINSLLVHDMPSISNTTTAPSATESWVKSKMQSVFASATLGFREFLYLDVTSRNDWSSTLPTGSNSYFYPSFGGSFVFSQLLNMNQSNILNYGKLRASWARVGNSAPPYQLANTYVLNGFFLGNPYLSYTTSLKNANLKPEQTVSKEIGLDLGFLKNRIRLNATLYKSNTTNQIITVSTPFETGFTSRVLNAGEIQNKGIELTLAGTPVQTKKFSWNITTNFSKNENLVVALIPGLNRVPLGSNLGVTVYAEVGMPYGSMRGNAPYKVGDTIIVGTNGRTIGDPNVLAGNYRPQWMGSVGNSFRYGQFDLSVLLTVKWGGSLYSASYGRAMFAGTTVKSLEGRDAWLFSYLLGENGNEQRNVGQTVGTTVTRYQDSARVKGLQYPNAYLAKTDASGNPILDKNGRMIPGQKSLGYVYPQLVNGNDKVLNDVPSLTFDASSIKISEFIFGYTFPQKWLSKAYIQGARIAFVGRNLWQIFQRTPLGIDPESANTSGNAQGIEAGGSYPYAQWGLDLKLSF